MDIEKLKTIFGKNFLGPNELNKFLNLLGLDPVSESVPELNLEEEILIKLSDNYLLILGPPEKKITISFLRSWAESQSKFSVNFYNQDWYLNEEFYFKELEFKWYLIKKNPVDSFNGKEPKDIILNEGYHLPSATLAAFTFFLYFVNFEIHLWKDHFIWCSDFDLNGDQIYVGRYFDPVGNNKPGFSIHRYLKLTNIYRAINIIEI